ncbi:hypothetical protein PGTUg99_016501 [Puccinia graminis f. sp. tritici]|uniref:Uncharacterized protein n=1 Tax=Puccinia graminis f. sp. tritici TaxID=56615 RepID=A0A5B0RH89_PUCGR|nr:hypothetical protein PGTUg99_016501 [Puccinia graminis f. sp. tritici]
MTTPSYRLDHKRSHELKIAASTRTTESSNLPHPPIPIHGPNTLDACQDPVVATK